MEKTVDTIKALARKKQFTQAEILELIAACHGAAKLFTALIEEDGSASEVPKIKYLQEEVRKAHQAALTQKEPNLGDDSVRRLGQCVSLLEEVSKKVPTNKRLQFTPAPAGGGGAAGGDNDAAAAPGAGSIEPEHREEVEGGTDASDDEEEEEEEVDSEAEYFAMIEAERVSFMGRAAWHTRVLHCLTAIVLILACVGVVFVSSGQYDSALENEKRSNMVTLLNVALDGLDVIASLSTSANLVTASERFLDDLANLRISLTAAPTVSQGSQFLYEYITVRYAVDIASGDRAFNRYVPRSLRLLCQDDNSIVVTSNNDLRYGVNRTKDVLRSDTCKTQTSGNGIWKKLGPSFLTYLPAEPTYRGVLAQQLGTIHVGSGLGVAVQVERDSLQTTITPNDEQVGVQNPLKEDWQKSTALWTSFAIAIGLLCCVVASEGAVWAAREEYLTDAVSAGVYALSVGLISLVVVISTAAISWSFLSDALDVHRLQHQQAVAKAAAAAVLSPTVQGLGGSLLLVERMISKSLNNTMCTTSTTTGAVYPSSPATSMASWLSNAYALISSGEFYASGTQKTSSGKLLLTSTYYLAEIPVLMTLYREVSMSNVILDAGKRSAGPTLGVLGTQVALILAYYLLTPLQMLWPHAGGAVWVEELLKPCNVRRVLYGVVAAVTFATSLAVAFYAVDLLKGQQSDIAAATGLSMAQALCVTASTSSVHDLSIINAGLPSFADAAAFVIDTTDLGSFASGSIPSMMPNQSPRFGIPAWNGWETNFYGAALALSNISTSVLAPAYFTLDVADGAWSLSEPGNIAYMQTSTAVDASGRYGVALQRFPESYEATPLMAYRIYASFVFAAIFAAGIACVVYEVAYRAASKVRSEDEYEEPSPVTVHLVAMCCILLLPAFAVLAGAGGSAMTMRSTLDAFAGRELAWQVAAMKPVLEHVAELQLSNPDSVVLDSMSTFVNVLNDRATTTLTSTFTRWILLQETSDFTLSKVFPIGGTDTQNSFYLPNLRDMHPTPQVGTMSTGFFYATTPRVVSYAAVEILNGLNALTEPKPATFLMLVADQHDVTMLADTTVTQVYKVAGACVVVLCIVFLLTFWYTYQLCEKTDFPVIDNAEVVQPLLINEDDAEDVAPPAMPRQLRLAHVFFFAIGVAVLVFFTASITYGAQTTRLVMEHASTLLDAQEHLITTAYDEIDEFWNYFLTSISAQFDSFKNTIATDSSDLGFAGFDWLNATGVTAIGESLDAIAASGTQLDAATTLFNVEDLVLSFSDSYHVRALKSFEELDRIDDIFYQLESVVGRLQVSAQRMIDSSSNASAPVPASYNITAIAVALRATSMMVDLSVKFSILNEISINLLLDFSDTIVDPKMMFDLATDGTAVKEAVRNAAAALVTRIDNVLATGLAALSHAYTDSDGSLSAARDVLQSARDTIVGSSAVLWPTAVQWVRQQDRIKEVFNALYGDNGTFASARALAAQTAITNAAAMIDAVRWEVVARKNKDFITQRPHAASMLPGPMYPSLAPWSPTERVNVAHDVDNFLITAAATTIVALALLGVGFAVVSALSYQRIASDAQATASISMSMHRTGDDDELDMETLLTKTTDMHYAAHVNTVRWVTIALLLLCVPIGMALWVAREGTDAAYHFVEEGTVALTLREVVEELPLLTERLMFQVGTGFAGNDLSEVQAAIDDINHVLIDAEKIIVRLHRDALRQYQTSGYDLAGASTERVRAAIVQSNLQQVRDFLTQMSANISYEAAVFSASLSQTVNRSNPIIIQQRLAAATARRLVGASDIDTILAPISPFGTTSSLATYVQERYASLLMNASTATTQASKREVIAQVVKFSSLLAEAQGIPQGFINYWHLQTASYRDNDDVITEHGTFEFVSASYLAAKGAFPVNVQNDISAMFLRIWQLTTPSPSAAKTLFSSTPLLPWSTSFSASTDLADGLLAAAATSTYFKDTTLAPQFQQLYAFNRRMYSADQLLENTKFEVPLLDLLDGIYNVLSNLSITDPVIRNTSAAPVPSTDTTSYFKATIDVPRYGTENPEYVSVAVEWTCAAAFWLAFVAFTFLVFDLRVLHV